MVKRSPTQVTSLSLLYMLALITRENNAACLVIVSGPTVRRRHRRSSLRWSPTLLPRCLEIVPRNEIDNRSRGCQAVFKHDRTESSVKLPHFLQETSGYNLSTIRILQCFCSGRGGESFIYYYLQRYCNLKFNFGILQ